MTTTTAAAPTARDLREELASVVHRLVESERRWQALTDLPEDFRQRQALATEIDRLRARSNALPEKITRAEKREAAIDRLRDVERQLRQAAEQQLADLLDRLPSRASIASVIASCQSANRALAALDGAMGGERTARPINALAEVRGGLQAVSKDLVYLQTAHAAADLPDELRAVLAELGASS